ncbi:9653_t:CDS:2, partial [Diversispora eburnea]
MYHRLRYYLVLNKTLPSRLSYFSSATNFNDKVSNKLNSASITEHTDQEIDKVLETYVNKEKLSIFKSIRKFEKEKNEKLLELLKDNNEKLLKSEKELLKSEKELLKSEKEKTEISVKYEIEKREKVIAQKNEILKEISMKFGNVNMSYLKLKGIVHIRGVLEHWETENLRGIEGNRGARWEKYFKNNNKDFETFRNFWPRPDEINIHHMVTEIVNFYKQLSDKIHNAHIGELVEWNCKRFTSIQNKIAEHMCKELRVNYRISDEEIETAIHNDKKDEIEITNDK